MSSNLYETFLYVNVDIDTESALETYTLQTFPAGWAFYHLCDPKLTFKVNSKIYSNFKSCMSWNVRILLNSEVPTRKELDPNEYFRYRETLVWTKALSENISPISLEGKNA